MPLGDSAKPVLGTGLKPALSVAGPVATPEEAHSLGQMAVIYAWALRVQRVRREEALPLDPITSQSLLGSLPQPVDDAALEEMEPL